MKMHTEVTLLYNAYSIPVLCMSISDVMNYFHVFFLLLFIKLNRSQPMAHMYTNREVRGRRDSQVSEVTFQLFEAWHASSYHYHYHEFFFEI